MLIWRQILSFLLTYFPLKFNLLSSNSNYHIITNEANHQEYDYIIIGAGSGGATLANRLSENANMQVAVIEAGGKTDILNEIPIAATSNANSTNDWAFFTEPQKYSFLGLNERRGFWVQGKVLGGTSSINAMIYMRGNRRDYDHWEKMGATGWGWKDVFAYFLKSEDNRDIGQEFQSAFHSSGGPMTVTRPIYASKIGDVFLKGADSLGYPTRLDQNGPFQTGVNRPQGTIRDGLRCGTLKAFLAPAAKRSNLHIFDHALALKIIFNDKKEAIAVQYEHEGIIKHLTARKEIIISCGAVNSPKLLMLSGVGPKTHLETLGIPVVADLPGVGQNLQDHIGVYMDFTVRDKGYTETPLRLATLGSAEFLLNRTGPLTLLGGSELIGYLKSSFADQTDDWPDIQYQVSPFSVANSPEPAIRFLNLKQNLWKSYYAPHQKDNAFLMVTWLLRPKSRGYIKLKDKDPHTPPLINPRYFSDPRDLPILINAVKKSMEIAQSKPLLDIGVSPFDTPLPGCENFEIWSDSYIECFIQTLGLSIYHIAGTCKMGLPENPDTVVDPQLKVKVVRKLRVVDASIMPTIVSGSLNAPCIMIAEKAADMIKRDQPYI